MTRSCWASGVSVGLECLDASLCRTAVVAEPSQSMRAAAFHIARLWTGVDQTQCTDSKMSSQKEVFLQPCTRCGW